MAERNFRRARSSRYAARLNEWHLELAIAVAVARKLLREHVLDDVAPSDPEAWATDCAHIIEKRLLELVETCPFPTSRAQPSELAAIPPGQVVPELVELPVCK